MKLGFKSHMYPLFHVFIMFVFFFTGIGHTLSVLHCSLVQWFRIVPLQVSSILIGATKWVVSSMVEQEAVNFEVISSSLILPA